MATSGGSLPRSTYARGDVAKARLFQAHKRRRKWKPFPEVFRSYPVRLLIARMLSALRIEPLGSPHIETPIGSKQSPATHRRTVLYNAPVLFPL